MQESNENADRSASWRGVIDDFIQIRLQAKLDKLQDEYGKEQAKASRQAELDALKETYLNNHAALRAAHRRQTWIVDAAKRALQLRIATHTVKPINPDAKGTTVNVRERFVTAPHYVGTHLFSELELPLDVVGNAAALDVAKFLEESFNGQTLLQALLHKDEEATNTLAESSDEAQHLADAFTSIATRTDGGASHTLAKQVYFPLPDGSYHLLAPLFPSALVHLWHLRLQSDRFSDATKASREARKKQEPGEPFRDYRNLVTQSFGGSKPQNISKLNSERGGKAFLLCSAPPNWQSAAIRPPKTDIFDGPYSKRAGVRETIQQLKTHLKKHGAADDNNRLIRNTRADLVSELIDELLFYASEIRTLEPEWSRAQGFSALPRSQRAWLDPHAPADEDEDPLPSNWPTTVARRFALWLNASIASDKLVLGDVESRQWRLELEPLLERMQDEVRHAT